MVAEFVVRQSTSLHKTFAPLFIYFFFFMIYSPHFVSWCEYSLIFPAASQGSCNIRLFTECIWTENSLEMKIPLWIFQFIKPTPFALKALL